MTDTQTAYPDYPVFKGLQRPLEFMGLSGRYIYWAGATIGCAVAGFILGYCALGFIAGLVLLLLSLSTGGALIAVKQRKGLHGKKTPKGVFVYACSRRI